MLAQWPVAVQTDTRRTNSKNGPVHQRSAVEVADHGAEHGQARIEALGPEEQLAHNDDNESAGDLECPISRRFPADAQAANRAAVGSMRLPATMSTK